MKKPKGPPDPIRSKIARGAKQKGSRAQREVAKLLGLWFFKDDNAFHSTPSSGGLRWSKYVAKTRGDIVCSVDEKFPYSIEIKNQEKGEWDLLSILLNEGPILKKWWKQCEEDAKIVGREPWLIITRNQIPFISILKHFDGNYLRNLGTPFFKFNNFYITPLAILLHHNSLHSIEEMKILNNKIINRHYINVLKRVNDNSKTSDNS